MAKEIVMPTLGLTMTEGLIEQWFVKEGDEIKENDVVAEISSEKLTSEVQAPEDGTIIKIVAQEGDELPVKAPMAYVGQPGESIPEEGGITLIEETAEETPTAKSESELQDEVLPMVGEGETGNDERVFITPVARKMAEEKGYDITNISGTGGNGRITKLDVERYQPSTKTQSDSETPRAQQSVEYGVGLEGMRQNVAKSMMTSIHSTAQLTHHSKADITDLMAFRKEIKGRVNKPLEKGEVSINTLLTKAVVLALQKFPQVNSWYHNGEFIEVQEIHIGMATALDDGLVVPVIKDADHMTLSQIGEAIQEVSSQARAGTLPGELYTGSTFTITNVGSVGVEYFTPILNNPETGILGVGALQTELALDEDGKVEERYMLPLSFTYDHQILDGVPAGQFVQEITSYLNDPYYLLL